MTTTDQSGILAVVRERIGLRQLKAGSVEWHGACPFCSSKDDGFMCWSDVGNYYCRKCGATGFSTQFVMATQGKTWKQAQAILGIDYNSNGKHAVENSEIAYHSRKHYAAVKGVPESVFSDAGFSEIETYQGRPAMKYPTYDKDDKKWWRVRFMDGKKPKYKPIETGTPTVWYRLQQAMGMSNKSEKPMVIVNGETSVVVAQHFGIPAYCKTGGEMKLPDFLLQELQEAYKNSRPRENLIALDCDEKGRRAAKAIEKQLLEGKWKPSIIDLGFADTGDFADFCKLHTDTSAKRLQGLVSASKPLSLNAHDASKTFTNYILNAKAPEGKILVNPFRVLHRLGGDAEFMMPKRLTIVMSMTGNGKTAFVESGVDSWLQYGHTGLWDGQEFGPDDYHIRRIMRSSGMVVKGLSKKERLPTVSYSDITSYKVHLQEQRDKVIAALRHGRDMFAGEIGKGRVKTFEFADKYIRSWPGYLEYVPYSPFLEDRIAFMTDWIRKRRASGKTVEFAVFDYVQLMKFANSPNPINPYPYGLGLMKNFAIENNIHVIAISQVNKQPSKQAKENNKRLIAQDMAYVKDDDANLTIALNFFYGAQLDEYGKPVLDYNGEEQIERKLLPDGTNAALVDVVKNTHGQVAPTKMVCDLAHLRWIDKQWGQTPLAI